MTVRPRPSVSALTLVLAALAGAGCATQQEPVIDPATVAPPQPNEITGRYIAIVCDGDLSATGDAPMTGKQPDMLTIVPLPLPNPDQMRKYSFPFKQVEVCNSSFGPPTAIAAAPDGRTVYVVESCKVGPDGAPDDDTGGDCLFAVSITGPTEASVTAKKRVGLRPISVHVNPQSDYLAIVTGEPGKQLVLVKSVGGALGEPVAFELPGVEDPKAEVGGVVWDPMGRHLAVTLPRQNKIAFYEFTRDAGEGLPGLRRWGQPVTAGQTCTSGVFTPDGRYFVVANLHQAPQASGFNVMPPEGSVSVIRLEAPPADGQISEVSHEVVSQVGVGVLPESIAVSPDGKYIVTANMRRSWRDEGEMAAASAAGSLSLLTINAQSGELKVCGEFDLKALPKGVSFDADGKNVIVAQYRSFDPGAVDSELAFFKLVGGARPALVPGQWFAGVGTGAHGVIIAK